MKIQLDKAFIVLFAIRYENVEIFSCMRIIIYSYSIHILKAFLCQLQRQNSFKSEVMNLGLYLRMIQIKILQTLCSLDQKGNTQQHSVIRIGPIKFISLLCNCDVIFLHCCIAFRYIVSDMLNFRYYCIFDVFIHKKK